MPLVIDNKIVNNFYLGSSLGVQMTIGGQRGASGLPAGATAVWYMDDYTDGGAFFRPHVPNAVAPTSTIPANLLSAPRHYFNNGSYYTKLASPTVTDDAVAGPTGITDAATVVAGASDWGLFWTITSLPAGTYTLVVEGMSNNGSDQSIRQGNGNGTLETKTYSTSYVRHATTFVHGGGNCPVNIVRASASAAASIRVYEACLYAGSVDRGRVTLEGHLVFGPDAYNGQPPTASGGLLTLGTGNKISLAQFEAFSNVTEFTVIGVGRRNGAPPGAGFYQAFLSSASTNGFNTLGAMFSDGTGEGQVLTFGSTSGSSGAGEIIGGEKGGLWNYQNDIWTSIGARYDGTTGTLWRGDIRAFQGTRASQSASLRDLVVGGILTSMANYSLSSVAYWTRALSDAEMRQAYNVLKARAARSSFTVTERDFYCAEGDSITWGTLTGVTQAYPHLYGVNSSPSVDGVVVARPSATLLAAFDIETGNSLEARAAYVDAMIPPNKGGRKFVLSLLVANDFVNGYSDAAAYAVAVSDYIAARRAAGWDKIALGTVLPRNNAPFNVLRNAYNAIITGTGWAAANGVDGIMDFAADATIGPDAAALDVGLYPDGIHPSQSVHTTYMEPIARAVLNSLLA